MSKVNSQTPQSLSTDELAIDLLFKRIAERGRRIQNRIKTADSDNLGRETLSAEQDPIRDGKDTYHE